MDSGRTSTIRQSRAEALLESFVGGERGRALRVQLSSRYPDCSVEEIEEAVQYACKSFLDEAKGVSTPGKVYAWIRTAAYRSLGREACRGRRELAVDPAGDGLAMVAADDLDPAEELISQEDDADLTALVREVAFSLSDRGQEVLALYGAGYKRPQIADRLGLTERAVKRDLLEIMDQARATLARLAGGGCDRGESLVMRFICGIASPMSQSRRASTFPIAAAVSCSASAWLPGGRRPARCFPPRWLKARAPGCSGRSRTHRRNGSRRSSSKCLTAGPR